MGLYSNIKTRRLQLGLSQDELAKLTGYKDRTSISKIEAGKVDLSQSKIALFAEALQTTRWALLGFEDVMDDIAMHSIIAFNIDDYKEQKLAKSIAAYSMQYIEEMYLPEKYTFSQQEKKLLGIFNRLNEKGQQNALSRIEELAEIPRYSKETGED